MKKEYNAPEMKVFRLEQRSTLLQSSDGDKTPVIHGPIGENLVDGPDLPVQRTKPAGLAPKMV